jgi:hypothetical protein
MVDELSATNIRREDDDKVTLCEQLAAQCALFQPRGEEK